MAETGARRMTWFVLSVLASAAVGFALYTTPHGAGISPDSVQYIAAAGSFLEGRGLPLELWAPLYPVVLAIGEVAGMGMLAWARLLNAALLGANLALAGAIIARHHPSSRLAPILGAGLLLISEDFVSIHAWIWTEPLALFIGFLGLYWLDRIWGSPKATALIAPALFLGLGCLVRYASLPFVAAGLLGLLLLGRENPLRTRLTRAAVFGAGALLPTIGWLGYLLGHTGRVAGRSIQFRPSALDELAGGLRIAADWILPGRVQGEVFRTWVGGALLLAWAVGTLAVLVGRDRTRSEEIPADVPRSADLLTLFVFAYTGMIVATRFFLSPSVSISHRIFSLGYAAIVVGGVAYAGHAAPWVRRLRARPWIRWAGAAVTATLFVLWAGLQLTHMLKWASEARSDGLGYATVEWRESPLLRFIRDLPAGTPVYSNGPDAIYALTGIAAKPLPDWPGGPALAGAPLPVPIARMSDELRATGGVIVYFRGI
ncbi:MAG: hypothetical protein ACRDHY_18480, partial [Anaerolineales bacterium]